MRARRTASDRRRPWRAAALLACLGLVALREPGLAEQDGTTRVDRPDLGVAFTVPEGWVEDGVPATEPFVLLRYKRTRQRGTIRFVTPRFAFVELDWVVDAEAVGDAEHDARGRPVRPVRSVERYAEIELGGWSVGPAVPGEPPTTLGEWRVSEIELRAPDGEGSARRRQAGRAFAWTLEGARTYALVGTCAAADLDEHLPAWREVAASVELLAPGRPLASELYARYEPTGFGDLADRVHARKVLPRGWRFVDSEHFAIAYSEGAGDSLVRRIAHDVELVRAEIARDFPPLSAPLATIKVLGDFDEYKAYTSSLPVEGSAAHWNPLVRELVLFDMTGEYGSRRDDRARTLATVYHEAFHQYVFHALGDVPPHPWFGEGYAEYYGAAKIVDGRFTGIGTHEHHERLLRRRIKRDEHIPFEELFAIESFLLSELDPSLLYAQSWSLVAFLRHEQDRGDSPWSEVLETYFHELDREWKKDGVDGAEGEGRHGVLRYPDAISDCRKRALAAALDGIELEALEAAWLEFATR